MKGKFTAAANYQSDKAGGYCTSKIDMGVQPFRRGPKYMYSRNVRKPVKLSGTNYRSANPPL